MGKYMRKTKLNGEVAVMEVSAQSSIGVRTRARTLALQRLQKPASSPAVDNSSPPSCYLQLRSRRLEKPSAAVKSMVSLDPPKALPCTEASQEADGGAEVSFGENVLEADSRDRETTPCSSLIRSSEAVRTPGSTSRTATRTTAISCRAQNAMRQDIPSTLEMEEFFLGSERLQQRTLIEKYNFDPVNDCPLPGRYEWVKLDS